MLDNKKRILDMLEASKISAEEAMKLLSAMDNADKEPDEINAKKEAFLKIPMFSTIRSPFDDDADEMDEDEEVGEDS